VLELDGLGEVARAGLGSQPAGVDPIHHPDGRSVGWSIGEGQDRVLIRWSSLAGDSMRLRLLADEDRVLIAIHPAGTEYLTTPHYAGPLERHRFEDDAEIDRLDPREDQSWDFVAGYLDADRILASTLTDGDEGLLLVNRAPMEIIAGVISEGIADRYSSVQWIGGGTWVTAGPDTTQLWSLD
jgi:hypothetical protein